MCSHLKAKIKGGTDLFNMLKGVRQGGLTSPALFNNLVSADHALLSACVYMVESMFFLFTYADDI